MKVIPLYQAIGGIQEAISYFSQRVKGETDEEFQRNLAKARLNQAFMEDLLNKYLPRGSGLDADWHLNVRSRVDRIIINGSYHEMIEGMYTRWWDFKIILKPTLSTGYTFTFIGLSKNSDLRDYLYDLFAEVFNQKVMYDTNNLYTV